MNPEQLLEEAATAIKHRGKSTTERWHLIYYRDRLCCVPTYENVPPEIILMEFTEIMVQRGFTITEWNNLQTRMIEFYKELN